jgi:hypothetical protein
MAESAVSIRLAAPFFSYVDALEMLGSEKNIFLIVRLGPLTDPRALRAAVEMPNVQVRFYTSSLFHTKLYLFGDECAVVGSANLTSAGMQSNREASVTVYPDQPEFGELNSLFEDYWSEATVMNEGEVSRYAEVWRRHPSDPREFTLEKDVKSVFGDTAPRTGIQVGRPKLTGARLYLADYRRTYQDFEKAYREVEASYLGSNRRKDVGVPVRIEIDQFFNYVRKIHCQGDDYLTAALLDAGSRKPKMDQLLDDWFDAEWSYLPDVIVPNFRLINESLGTKDAVERQNPTSILEAIKVCHAFTEQLRFFRGGLTSLEAEFLRNDVGAVKHSIKYLLHGEGSYIDRMGAVIHEKRYHIPNMGRSVVQELLGWVNRENVPICNGRTMKVLRFIGHDVRTD